MGREVEETCKDCKHKCVLIHGKNNEHPLFPTSFFKIMIGDQYSKVLYLPPKFARTASDLVGQKTHLKDSSGRQWCVELLRLNGSLAFKHGWQKFSFDHALKVGDFVVFHYVTGSHFIVQIYDKSGCEKLDLPEENENPKKRARACNENENPKKRGRACHESENPKKRARACNNSSSKDGTHPLRTSDNNSMNKPGSSSSEIFGSNLELPQSQSELNDVDKVPMAADNTSNCGNSKEIPLPLCKAKHAEEPDFLINRDLTYKQGEDRSSMFDLSNFEIRNSASVVNERNRILAGNERSPLHVGTLLRSQTESGLVGYCPVDLEGPSIEGLADASVSKTIEMRNSSSVVNERNRILAVNKRYPLHVDALLRSKTESGLVGNNPVDLEGESIEGLADASVFKTVAGVNKLDNKEKIALTCDGDSCNETSRNLVILSAENPGENGKDRPDMSDKVIKKCQIAEQRSNICKKSSPADNPVDESQKEQGSFCRGERLMFIKQELVDKISERCCHKNMMQGEEAEFIEGVRIQSPTLTLKYNEANEVVKIEPSDAIDFSSPIVASISCLVTTDKQSLLELPMCLPSRSYRGRNKTDRKVIYLRDPVTRLWPVVYHERYNLKVLMSGWEAFSKANNIQKGDECVFTVENEVEDIYGVSIIRRF